MQERGECDRDGSNSAKTQAQKQMITIQKGAELGGWGRAKTVLMDGIFKGADSPMLIMVDLPDTTVSGGEK